MSRLHALWIRRRTDLLFWTVCAASFLLTYISYVKWFRLYYPDSRYYLARTFLFLGNSPEAARDLTLAYSAPRNIAVPDIDLLFGWGLVQPRVVLPALSTPFVAWFGPEGLAVVPLIATVVGVTLMIVMVRRRFGTLPALTVALLTNLSMFLVSFETGMLTESLSSLFTVLALVAAWRWLRDPRPWHLVVMGGVTVLSAFTRQATFIVGGAFLLAWLLDMVVQRRWRSRWMWPGVVVAGTAVACQLLQSIVFPSFSQADQFTTQTGTHSLGAAILAAPGLLIQIIKADVLSMMRNDRALLVLICLAIAGMILFWRRVEAHLLFGALLATGLYNVTNGTPTAFRYATPGLVFWVLCAAMTIAATATWIKRAGGRDSAEGPMVPAAGDAAEAGAR
ncbi:glycosyltransferase family 39 protein [Microbacterium sp.]|uniref:ArnT family glycosyltransferase n=1 Tax=Microbacterium sp. TaxID=51671 RepID=UPI003342D8B3